MLIALWIVNILLAAAMLGAGTMKSIKTKEAIVAGGMAWADDFQPAAIKGIGALEVVGAVGLIVPLATGILPILAPIAATGLAIVMMGAVAVHRRRNEPVMPALAFAILAIASAVIGFIAVS